MDEDMEVKRILEALGNLGDSVEVGPPTDPGVIRDRIRRSRRARIVRRTLAVGVSLAAVGAVLAGLVYYLSGERSASVATLRSVPAAPRREPQARQRPTSPLRVEPFDGVSAVIPESAKVEFPSPRRAVLTAGTIAFQVRPDAGPGALVVETPAADVRVVGTVLSLSVEDAGTGVEVLHGRVDVAFRSGRVVTLGDRQMLRPGSVTVEPLPEDSAARLSLLFPSERPPPNAAAAEPPPFPLRPDDVQPGPSRSPPREDRSPGGPPLDEVYRQAEAAMREGRNGGATELLREILGRTPAGSAREETALIDLALVCSQLGDLAGQREALEKYLAHHPRGALREDARHDLCRVLQRTAPPAALRSCLAEYLSEFPDGRTAEWARGMLAHEAAPAVAPTGDGG